MKIYFLVFFVSAFQSTIFLDESVSSFNDMDLLSQVIKDDLLVTCLFLNKLTHQNQSCYAPEELKPKEANCIKNFEEVLDQSFRDKNCLLVKYPEKYSNCLSSF